MKKSIFVFTFLLLGMYYSQAQQLSYGVKAGANYSTFHYADTNFESVSEFDWRVGFYLGGLAEYKFPNDWFALQAELLYSNQGAKRKLDLTLLGGFTSPDPIFIEKLDINYTFSYLTLPILAKFYVTKGLNLFAGPQIEFLLSASANDQTITKGLE